MTIPLLQTIRTFNSRMVRIENSVTWVTLWHHGAMPSDVEQLSRVTEFSFEPYNHYRFVLFHTVLSTIAFRLEYVFYQFYAKKLHFVQLLSYKLMLKHLVETRHHK